MVIWSFSDLFSPMQAFSVVGLSPSCKLIARTTILSTPHPVAQSHEKRARNTSAMFLASCDLTNRVFRRIGSAFVASCISLLVVVPSVAMSIRIIGHDSSSGAFAAFVAVPTDTV